MSYPTKAMFCWLGVCVAFDFAVGLHGIPHFVVRTVGVFPAYWFGVYAQRALGRNDR